jgi:hypothetical protein
MHERAFYDALISAFPVGSSLSYRHGQNNRVAEVLGHSQDRIRLIGTMRVEYWKYWDESFCSVRLRGKEKDDD